jgi:hypothetical protein
VPVVPYQVLPIICSYHRSSWPQLSVTFGLRMVFSKPRRQKSIPAFGKSAVHLQTCLNVEAFPTHDTFLCVEALEVTICHSFGQCKRARHHIHIRVPRSCVFGIFCMSCCSDTDSCLTVGRIKSVYGSLRGHVRVPNNIVSTQPETQANPPERHGK